jgi:hypothetical protein
MHVMKKTAVRNSVSTIRENAPEIGHTNLEMKRFVQEVSATLRGAARAAT